MNLLEKLKSVFTKYNFSRAVIFCLTFISYALLHANRKSFSNVKPTIKQVWTPQFNNETVPQLLPSKLWTSHNLFNNENSAENYLGQLDAVFMASYAIGLYINGYLGDIFSPRWVLGTGMILSSFAIFVFGVLTEWLHFYNVYFYGFFYVLNGLFQSTGWPAAVAIMAYWFGSSRGFWMGLWSSCASVGNVFGDYLTGLVLDYGYEYGFLVPAAFLFTGGLVIFSGIIVSPLELGTQSASKHYISVQASIDSTMDGDLVSVEETSIKPLKKMSILRIILIPGVISYALAYACLKSVNYAFFFWLSDYLSSNFHWSNSLADKISVWYDVGSIIGGIISGLISDLMWARSPIIVFSLVLTIPSLVLYRSAPGDATINSIYMAVTGFFIGGPANLISSAISADLGTQPSFSGNADALATVTGIIDGTGSVGAAIGQVCVPLISHRYGWQAVFIFFMLMISMTVVCLLPILIKDIWLRIIIYRNHQLTRQKFPVVRTNPSTSNSANELSDNDEEANENEALLDNNRNLIKV